MLRLWNLPVVASPSLVELLQHVRYLPLHLQLLVLAVEEQGSAGVLTAVVGALLNVHVQEEPGQELEGDVALVGEVEQLHRVYNLLWRNLEVKVQAWHHCTYSNPNRPKSDVKLLGGSLI